MSQASTSFKLFSCYQRSHFPFFIWTLIGGYEAFTSKTVQALLCNSATIILTIHAQDFADVDGDAKSGRVTFPIAYPRISRIYMLWALPTWSLILSLSWSLPKIATLPFMLLAYIVALRLYMFHNTESDSATYTIYNVRTFLLTNGVIDQT